ncbi:purine-cytosine permease family protein [Arthrobacter dokdonensis]|uniref:purine-cytosine permease family protein n=1 Tax=Arthrobacter dokdonellae TaxID=2211210 RepID=UPI000DE5ABC2|nr:cytosine permease [Arthrobacter dokdonellae]
MSTKQKSRLFEIEQESIAPIPENARHGKARELFTIWFGMNMTPLTVVTGATATTLLGLPLLPSILAILLGHALGGIGMALHAAQGPALGVPQMLQARGQFGSKGASLIVAVAIVMFVGYFSSNLIISAHSITTLVPGANSSVLIIGCAALSFVIAAFGYNLVRKVTQLGAVIVGALVLVSFVALFLNGDFWGNVTAGTFSWPGFLAMLAIGIVWQLTYAPYVSDYSRYMPAKSGTKGAFWGTYLGCVTSSALLMVLGASVGLAVKGADTMAGLHGILGPILGLVVLVCFALVAASGNAVNAYCSALCALTLVETFRSGWRPGAKARLVTSVVLHLVGVGLALTAATNFASSYFSFLSILLYVLIPWSAVNLVDYYIIRHGSYAVSEFYAADGGRYGRWNAGALLVFFVGVAAQIPFMSTPFYTGPVARAMNGIDIAWFVGLTVSAVAYIAIAKLAPAMVRMAIPGTPVPALRK